MRTGIVAIGQVVHIIISATTQDLLKMGVAIFMVVDALSTTLVIMAFVATVRVIGMKGGGAKKASAFPKLAHWFFLPLVYSFW